MRYERNTSRESADLKEFIKRFSTIKDMYEGVADGRAAVEVLIEKLDSFGRYLAKTANLKTTQIRKFFSSVKKIQSELRSGRESTNPRQKILRLKPALAYATARQKKQLQEFTEVMYLAMDMVKEPEDFEYFVEFLEAIVAYHKFHGGRD